MRKAKKETENAPKTPKAFTFTASRSPEALKEAIREAAFATGEMLYEKTEAGFDLGVARGGHSGGYWYVATLTEQDGETAVSGEIVYRSYHGDGKLREDTKWEKLCGWVGIVLLVLLFFPIILIVLAVRGIMTLIGMLRGKPAKKDMTSEEKLTHFMTETVGCRVEK